jgi:signal transduction histidine kinase
MNVAIRNVRLAVQQKVADAYRGALAEAAAEVDDRWEGLAAALAQSVADAGPARSFADLVGSGACDSLITYDPAKQAGYPTPPLPATPVQAAKTDEWNRAEHLENDLRGFPAAARAYAEAARLAPGKDLAALALLAQARCQARAGDGDGAVTTLMRIAADPAYADTRDQQGRFIVPAAQLRALELLRDSDRPERKDILEALARRLTDYGEPLLPSSQRVFLMRRLQEIAPDCPPFPTLAGEELAAECLARSPLSATPSALTPAGIEGVWQLASPDGHAVAFFRQQSVVRESERLLSARAALAQVTVTVLPPGRALAGRPAFLTAPLGSRLAGWQVALQLPDPDPFAAAARRQVAAYVWTGFLVIVVIALAALLAARYLLGQVRLARLKNDFLATVSHELKTPLSSMRVLVDTLLDGHYRDQQQAVEYLQLLAKENLRLSRLIDNFLTFSRMERNKVAFDCQPLRPDEIVNEAVESVRDRFESAGFKLDVEPSPGLPTVNGDRDALVTVMLNLLDNAYKYSGAGKRVRVRAYGQDRNMCLEVQDNGIGISRRAARKIFDRFYQVDRSLSRNAGGCGLGLSIVKFIISAHGGTVQVKSQPGKGSTFTVLLPVEKG